MIVFSTFFLLSAMPLACTDFSIAKTACFRQRANRVCIKGQSKINKAVLTCESCRATLMEPQNENIKLEISITDPL